MKELILLVYFISLVSLWIVGMVVIDWYLAQDKALAVIVPISYIIVGAVQCYLVTNASLRGSK